jgi:LuxR family transcriptional regulator, maltose regulon positive regulatory protein
VDTPRYAATKIQPPRPRSARIARPRLDGALAAALGRRRVFLLVAPAGFGKTSLLAAQIAALPEGTALAWVSLDEDDDAPRLYACLAGALEPHDLPWRSAPEALATQVGDEGEGTRRAVAELLNALAGAEAPHGVIVLDDLHRVQAPQVHTLLDALIERLPPQWLIVLATRVEPPLALARWRAADELGELQQDDLRFREDEARALFAAEHDGASGGDSGGEPLAGRIAELVERTQGWPAGLRLCLAALRTRPGSAGGLARRGSAAVDRALFDYLASEVLDDMPPALHDFLVRCAVLPVLTAARAAAVTGDAQAAERLDEIERRGLFVTALEAQERTLVLHDLFRDALDDRLRRRFPAELPALLQRAAAGETDPVRRVGFELRAGDWAAAEATLAGAAEEMMLQGLAGEVMRLALQFPADWRAASSRLQRLHGLAACLRWQWSEMASSMQAAVAAAQASGDAAELQISQVYLIAAYHAVGRLDEANALLEQLRPQALDAHAAVLLLDAECSQRFQRGDYGPLPKLYARLMDRLEELQSLFAWWECSPPASWSTLPGIGPLLDRYARHALHLCGERELPLRATLHSLQAYLHLWAGRTDAALDAMRTAQADARWLAGSAEIEANLAVLALIVAALRGEGDVVRRDIETLFRREDGQAQPERVRHWHHQVANFAVRLIAALDGDASELRHWVARLMPVPEGGPPSPRDARLAAAEGRWPAAAEAYVALLPHVARLDLMGQAVELHLRAGHALLRCARLADAARTLRPGLERIRAEGVPGHALMAGPNVLAELAAARWGTALDATEQALLHELVAMSAAMRGSAASPAAVRAVAPAQAPGGSTAADTLLSGREREVLERMAAGDSNKLIARQLDISPHTVKRHVANILDKLALGSRGQAAAWLRANG